MKPRVALLAAATFALAACNAGPQQGAAGSSSQGASAAPGAGVAGTYEFAQTDASLKSSDDLYKINVKTGAAWVHCCAGSNSNFVPIADSSSLPPGDYHLTTYSILDTNGEITWNVYRVDSASGRAWEFTNNGQGAVGWQELSGTATSLQ